MGSDTPVIGKRTYDSFTTDFYRFRVVFGSGVETLGQYLERSVFRRVPSCTGPVSGT